MSVAVIFEVPHMTAAQYDQVIKDLEAAGQARPRGRQYHVASPMGEGWHVLDVWESAEALGRFAQVLMPILVRNGVNPPPTPKVLPAHNIIKG